MEDKQRIIQELVPGRQVTLAHIIERPDAVLYEKLGLNLSEDPSRSAIAILTISPAETAIVMADIGVKSAGVRLGFVDRFSGTVLFTGKTEEIEIAIREILSYVEEDLGYTVCPVSKT